MRRLPRILLMTFVLSGLAPALPAARAQDEGVPVEGESKGDPLYGYVGTAFLAAGALFVLCKSARR